MNEWLLDCLDVVASLGATLASDARNDSPDAVFRAARAALAQVHCFEAMAFLTVDGDENFELVDCEPPAARTRVGEQIACLIDDGAFGWAVRQNRPVLVPTDPQGETTVLHVIATPSRVLGMFAGILDPVRRVFPSLHRKLLSTILAHCGFRLEAILLYRELDSRARGSGSESDRHGADSGRPAVDRRSAVRERSDLLVAATGGLRRPLGEVLRMSDALLQSELSREQREWGESIHSAATTLLTAVNDILDFSELEAGRLRLRVAPFDLESCVSQAATLLRGVAEGKGLELAVSYESGTLSRLIGDAARIRQVLTALVLNAIASSKRGCVRIRVACEERSEERARMRISVSDRGAGVSEEALERIFDEFGTEDRPALCDDRNSGLGLGLCARLVELMGGALGATTRVGEGSIFWMTLFLDIERDAG